MSEILNVLNSIGYTSLTDFGNSWRCDPLYRSFRSRNSLAIKKTTGQWFDHSERYGGSLAKLVQKTLGLASLSDTKAYMGDLPITVDTRESVELTEIKKFDKNILIKLVKDNSYWHERGISKKIINIFKCGIAKNGRMKDRFVFCIFDKQNNLIGFSGRDLSNKSDIKWKILGQKKNFIFPIIKSQVKINDVVLVESIGDFLSLLEIGVKNILVLFGVSLSDSLIFELIKLDPKRIFIAMNNDCQTGFVGNSAANEIEIQLQSFFDKNQVFNITTEINHNDFNGWLLKDKESLINFVKNREIECNSIYDFTYLQDNQSN